MRARIQAHLRPPHPFARRHGIREACRSYASRLGHANAPAPVLPAFGDVTLHRFSLACAKARLFS